MGISTDAHVGWGVVLNQDGDEARYGDHLADEELDGLLGFTEQAPQPPAVRIPGTDGFTAWRASRSAWQNRRDAAVPVEGRWFGHIEYQGYLLAVKRTVQEVNWGAIDINPMVLITVLREAEVTAISKICDHVGFRGDRTPKLLLWASYG